jgi:GWxTD domain-containing protein
LELHLKLKSWDDALYYDINLSKELEYGSGGLILCDGTSGKPIFNNFISASTNIQVKTISGNEKEIWVYHYNTDFDIAIPPMIVDNTNVTRSLTVNKTMKMYAGDTLNFDEEGLYFVQSDTNSLEGVAFRIQNEPFPKLGTYEELIKPIRFISTKTEIEEIENETDVKKSFESFWIKTNTSASLAQKTIKNYYKYVAEANFYFTGYKEGWKTDMGMIYIIYGAPDKVYRHEEYEQWIYNQNVNMPAIRFTFVKIKNVFSTNHYTLVRDRKFDKQWFRGVELRRKGKM